MVGYFTIEVYRFITSFGMQYIYTVYILQSYITIIPKYMIILFGNQTWELEILYKWIIELQGLFSIAMFDSQQVKKNQLRSPKINLHSR
jgi:hypothetical protein